MDKETSCIIFIDDNEAALSEEILAKIIAQALVDRLKKNGAGKESNYLGLSH